VPPGVTEGQRILFEGGGEISHHHGPSGDLYVEINIQPDSIFSREGSDLHCVVTIDSQVAINGGKYYLKTPMGDINLIIPLASKDGQLLRLKGRGIKHPNSDERGDLIAHLKVEEDAGLLDKVKRFFDNIGH
jgi:molecular chaperone DnaJ